MLKIIVCLVVALALVSSASATLVSQYEFEGNFNDSWGGHDGDPRGDATILYDADRGGNVLSLDGDGDAVATPAIGSLDEFTIAMWITAETLGSGAAKISLFSTPYGADAGLQIQSRAQKLQVLVGKGAGSGINKIDGSPLALNDWIHLAVTFKSDELAGYINGELDVSQVLTAAPAANVGAAYIGNWLNTSDVFVRGFTGKMDDVRIYDEALSAAQIMAIVPEPATIALLGLGGLALIRRRRG
jgi:hypothetical protein